MCNKRRKYKSIVKKKRKKLDEIVLLPKSGLNSIDVLISKALINSNICQDDFFKGTEATCVEIASETKKCFRLKDMLDFKVLLNF